jgi:hypothetical protein
MALTRNDLKEIIKECILEVMLDGLRGGEPERAPQMSESTRRLPSAPNGKKHLDSITFSAGASKVADQAQGRRAPPPVSQELVSSFPKEQRNVMQQIFEDTARNTLPAQLTAERNPAAAMSQAQGVPDVDPMSMFDGASNWADLAFAASKK